MNRQRKTTIRNSRLSGSLGVTAVEYALVLGLVVIGIMGALTGFDDQAKDGLTDRGNRVGNPEALRATDTVPSGPIATTTTLLGTTTTTAYVGPTTTTTTTTIVLPTTTAAPPGPTTTLAPAPTTTIVSATPHAFVGSMSGSSARIGNTWTATVLVTVVNQHGAPLSGVLVAGGWSQSTAHVADCVTGLAGSCTVSQTDLDRTGADAILATTYFVLSLSGDGIIPVGPDPAVDFLEVTIP